MLEHNKTLVEVLFEYDEKGYNFGDKYMFKGKTSTGFELYSEDTLVMFFKVSRAVLNRYGFRTGKDFTRFYYEMVSPAIEFNTITYRTHTISYVLYTPKALKDHQQMTFIIEKSDHYFQVTFRSKSDVMQSNYKEHIEWMLSIRHNFLD